MKTTIAVIGALFLTLSVIAPQFASAAQNMEGTVTMKAGSKIHLYHSGSGDMKNTTCKQDVIPVYRGTVIGYRSPKTPEQVKGLKEVGKIKMLSYRGDNYCEAEVVQGEVRVGDVTKKEGANCLVQTADTVKPSV